MLVNVMYTVGKCHIYFNICTFTSISAHWMRSWLNHPMGVKVTALFCANNEAPDTPHPHP